MAGYTQFRLQRARRQQRRRLQNWWHEASRFLRFSLFGKWRQLAMIRRFALAWWLIVLITAIGLIVQIGGLASQSVVAQPLPGGNYSEAIVGTIKNLNPVLPEDSATAAANHLIFSGLTEFNTQGQLEPDLAKSWTVSADAKTYTFHLRHGVAWQDGVPFTAQDVVFTLTAIQNPDTRSPLTPSWQKVKVTAPNDYTVVFSLPKPYPPFITTTTLGILPAHLLENTDPFSLRVASFNQNPIGTGPFKVNHYDPNSGEVNLTANPTYYFGRPLLDSITLRLYGTPAAALAAYEHRQVQGVDQVGPGQIMAARNLGTLKIYDASVPNEVGVFLQTASPILKDKTVRLALANATDRDAIIRDQLHNLATPLAGPLLPSPLIAGAPHQPNLDVSKADSLLTDDGWQVGHDGVRAKNGTRLELQLVTQSGNVYDGVAHQLARQWAQVGVRVNITEVAADNLQQSYIRTRHYDALLYGINTGADPDVYAYWDSSQMKDPGLNLSDYDSPAADKALEAGRIISDPSLRAAKYRSFVQTWVADTPAVMLYTPSYDYGVDASVHGISLRKLIDPADRFSNVEYWSVRQREVPGS